MLDEAHERNINTDIVIGLLKKVYKDTIIVIIMMIYR